MKKKNIFPSTRPGSTIMSNYACVRKTHARIAAKHTAPSVCVIVFARSFAAEQKIGLGRNAWNTFRNMEREFSVNAFRSAIDYDAASSRP